MEAVVVFPHQLFKNHPGFQKDRLILLVEEARFFSEFQFHKQKLIFHRATLKSFESSLKKKGYKTQYIEGGVKEALEKITPKVLHVAELDDAPLMKMITSLAKSLQIRLEVAPSPGFLTDLNEFFSFFKGKKQLRFEPFYIAQRKRLDLLLDKGGKPLGGKWSLDAENRKKLPKTVKIPEPFKPRMGKELDEAIEYIEKKYAHHPGMIESFNYPVTHGEARKSLAHFLEHRLPLFGDYEDAISQKESTLFHSSLSPLLNVGLLTPDEVVEGAIESFKRGRIPLNCAEGFIRQVIGWREYVRGVYHLIGDQERKGNFFKHKRKLPPSFYDGTTGIVPIDATIQKVMKHGYAHHIERLMVLGNFFFLCEIDPNEVYRWFMELFIDAYDWVMVPNVYGMSQYADGGMITTKPYMSGSNYLLKMSDYPKGDWCKIWDALFWRFMIKHSSFFENQPRLNVLCQMAKKKKKEKGLLQLAETFMEGMGTRQGKTGRK